MPKKNSGENLGRSLLRKKHNNFNASTRHTTIDESDGKHSANCNKSIFFICVLLNVI